jgi:hypothetical protein
MDLIVRYDGGFELEGEAPRGAALEGESLRLYGQVNKRTWWMPWQPEAMKDVVDCDKSRGAVKQALIREFPNGETHSIYRVSLTEYIG